MPPEFIRELDALRRRAYGVDADIACDPVALRRLSELEAATHPTATAEEPPIESAPALLAADEPDELHDPIRHESAVRVAVLPPSTIRVTAFVVAAIVAVGWAAGLSSGSRGDDVLVARQSTQQERQDLIDQVDLAALDMIGARLQRFDEFRDLSVWSATGGSGVTCLLVGSDGRGAFHVGCTPAPLRPSLDLRVGNTLRPEVVGDLPVGSVVRLVLHGDDVGVWVAEAAGIDR